jgi:hypothetical protein
VKVDKIDVSRFEDMVVLNQGLAPDDPMILIPADQVAFITALMRNQAEKILNPNRGEGV